MEQADSDSDEGAGPGVHLPSELLAAYLRACSASGDTHMVKYLSEMCDLVNVPNARGQRCLHVACGAGQLGAAAVLITRGALMDARSDDGSTPLHAACAADKPLLVKLLLKHGASTSIVDKNGKTAAQVAQPAALAALGSVATPVHVE